MNGKLLDSSGFSGSKRYREKLQEIQALEYSVMRKTCEKRRKIVALLDQMPAYRKTIARYFISVTYEKVDEQTNEMPVNDNFNPAPIENRGMNVDSGLDPLPEIMQQNLQAPTQTVEEMKNTQTSRQIRGKWTLLIDGCLVHPNTEYGDEGEIISKDEDANSR